MRDNLRLRYTLLVGVTALWAGTFVFIKQGLAYSDALTFVVLRFTIATFATLLIWSRTWRTVWNVELLKHGIVLGISYGVGFYLQTWGLLSTSIPRSAFFTGTFVVFVPLLQLLIWRRMPCKQEWIGVALGMIGIALLSSPGAGSLNQGDIATLGGALAWSFYMCYLSYAGIERLQNFSSGTLVFLQCGITALLGCGMYGVMALVKLHEIWQPQLTWSWELVFAVLYCSMLATVLATYLQTHLQPGISAVQASLIFALEPVLATLFSFLTVGETLNPMETSGAGMLIVAALVTTRQ